MDRSVNSNNQTDGGIQKSRGSLFQQYGILLYMLLRYLEQSDLDITIEPSEGEDAKFVLTSVDPGNTSPVTELVQYKKTESAEQTPESEKLGDDWKEGPITPWALKKWVTRKRPHISVEDILNEESNTFFTAIVFGKIAPGLKGFIPERLQEHMSSYSGLGPQFFQMFPIDYTHPQDPLINQTNKKLVFGTKELRKRVRLLRFSSPAMLELQCRYILERFYKIPRGAAPGVVDRLIVEIARREAIKNEADRRLLKFEIEPILAEARKRGNKWQEARHFLQQHIQTPADPNRGESPRWFDFERGRFGKFDEFEQTWIDLIRNGFVVICGLPGTGKTVLAGYLAYRFVTESANRTAYYLEIKSNVSLRDEIEFLVDRIETDTLFIVDDQHLAFDEVELLTQTFADYHSIGKATARLVVTSVQIFGKTGRGKRGRETVLSQAILTRLIYGETNKTRDCISALRTNCGLQSPLSDDELMSLSGGNLALALLLARCAYDIGPKVHPTTLSESRVLKQTITEWLLLKLGLTEPTLFKSDVVPIFITGASSLPITQSFTQLVSLAADAGFLQEDDFNENPSQNAYLVRDSALARLIRNYYNAEELDVLTTYVKTYPEWLPLFCERLAERSYGPAILRQLFKHERGFLVETINDPVRPFQLDDVSKILRSINLADHGGEDVRLLRALMSSDGSPNYRFFSRFIRPERIQQVESIAVFFNTLHRIDRYVASAVAASIGSDQVDILLNLIAAPDCRLDQVGLCLHAINRCSREVADVLYERFKGTATVPETQ